MNKDMRIGLMKSVVSLDELIAQADLFEPEFIGWKDALSQWWEKSERQYKAYCVARSIHPSSRELSMYCSVSTYSFFRSVVDAHQNGGKEDGNK